MQTTMLARARKALLPPPLAARRRRSVSLAISQRGDNRNDRREERGSRRQRKLGRSVGRRFVGGARPRLAATRKLYLNALEDECFLTLRTLGRCRARQLSRRDKCMEDASCAYVRVLFFFFLIACRCAQHHAADLGIST